MQLLANAKINLSLNVVERKSNGYHELESIMVPLAWGDYLEIEECESETYLTSNSTTIPLDDRNLLIKAYHFMNNHYEINKHFHIHIQKEIPTEAGLGGGSSDAGALLRFLHDYCKVNEPLEEVALKSVEIGADIPFCVMNRPSLVQGVGEHLRNVCFPALEPYYVLLVKPSEGVSTKEAYQTLQLEECDHPDIEALVRKLNEGENFELGNSLEQSAFRIVSHIAEIKKQLKLLGFDHALMSGSGSCVFGLTKNNDILEKGYQYFEKNEEFVKKTRIICE